MIKNSLQQIQLIEDIYKLNFVDSQFTELLFSQLDIFFKSNQQQNNKEDDDLNQTIDGEDQSQQESKGE